MDIQRKFAKKQSHKTNVIYLYISVLILQFGDETYTVDENPLSRFTSVFQPIQYVIVLGEGIFFRVKYFFRAACLFPLKMCSNHSKCPKDQIVIGLVISSQTRALHSFNFEIAGATSP